MLASVPSTPTLGFLLFRWFHLGLTAGCDYGYGPPCVGAFDPNFRFGFLLNCRSLAGMAPLVPFDGDAGSRARHRPPSTPTLGFLLFRWFHLGLTAGCDYGGYGPPCVVLLIRTFLWLSAGLPLSRGDGPLVRFRRGRWLACSPPSPPHLLLAFSYFGGFIWG